MWILRFYRSSLGKKVVMVATGIALFGYIVGHLAGNLQIFAGPETLDAYARLLKDTPQLLWTTRIALASAVGLHFLAAAQLAIRNRSARPVPYRRHKYRDASYASRTMVWSGPIIALFVVYHLLHFTIGSVHPSYPNFNPETVYQNVITGFQQWPVALFYIAAVLSLGLHMGHGIWSMFQSIGLNHSKYDPLVRRGSVIISSFIVAGYLSIPLAVLIGVVG